MYALMDIFIEDTHTRTAYMFRSYWGLPCVITLYCSIHIMDMPCSILNYSILYYKLLYRDVRPYHFMLLVPLQSKYSLCLHSHAEIQIHLFCCCWRSLLCRIYPNSPKLSIWILLGNFDVEKLFQSVEFESVWLFSYN